MRLARYAQADREALAILTEDGLVDVNVLDTRLDNDLTAIVGGGRDLWRSLESAASAARATSAIDEVELLAPIPRPPKFLAVGMNSPDHVSEVADGGSAEMTRAMASMALVRQAFPNPRLPTVFNKQTSCVTGPHADIWAPADAETLDYEGELALVIGRRARRLDEAAAADAIAGYLVTNDVSVREWQNDTPLMWPGKSFETHGPTGPFLVTADELDVSGLRVRTWVNGELRQDGNTNDWILKPAQVVSILSQICTLEPGDLIAMGTPAGIGIADGRYLSSGDRVEVEVEGIGRLDNRVVPEP